MMDLLDGNVLESNFGEYSPSAKAYRTHGGKDVFFYDVANFLLEVAYVSRRQYCRPKQRAGFIIATYKGSKVDWGYITGVELREQLHGVQNGFKSMKPIFAQGRTPVADTGRKTSKKEKGQSSQAQPKKLVRRTVPREEWQEEPAINTQHQPNTEVQKPETDTNTQ